MLGSATWADKSDTFIHEMWNVAWSWPELIHMFRPSSVDGECIYFSRALETQGGIRTYRETDRRLKLV